MEQVIDALLQAALLVLLALISYGAKVFTAYLKKEGMIAELEAKQAYVDIAVKAAEQMFKEADGPAKFNKAKSQFVDWLNKNKIKFTDAELDSLIESAVKNMKDGINAGLVEEVKVDETIGAHSPIEK